MVQTSKKQQIKVTCLNGKFNFWNSDPLASYFLYFAEHYFIFLKGLNDITHVAFALTDIKMLYIPSFYNGKGIILKGKKKFQLRNIL